MTRTTWRHWLRILALAAPLGGCAVGPNFVRPAAPTTKTYTASPTSAVMAPTTGETAQRIQLGKEISAQWWQLFRSSSLDRVLDAAIQGSRTLAAARATLAQAQEAVVAARGRFFPQLDLGAGAQRQQSADLGAGAATGVFRSSGHQVSNLYTIGPSVSYALDVFGGLRRTLEQQKALAQFQRYELAAAYLTLTGNAVTQAVIIASTHAQIQATRDVVHDDQQNLDLVKRKLEAGKAARTEVLTAETQLASDRTPLPTLEQQLAAARHALSVLAGRFPAEWSPPAFELDDFTLPSNLPLSLPSALVHQRPDILSAEAQLHAASAAIGVATANLYPNLTLSGSLTQEALETSALFTGAGTAWSLAARLASPIFHGGTLLANRRAAIYAYQASLATYQQTVLQAFQQVADTLRALSHDADLVDSEHQVLVAARDALALQRLSYQAGKTDLLQLLDAERSYQQARLGFARAKAQRLQDTAQLFVALGGGWWKAPASS